MRKSLNKALPTLCSTKTRNPRFSFCIYVVQVTNKEKFCTLRLAIFFISEEILPSFPCFKMSAHKDIIGNTMRKFGQKFGAAKINMLEKIGKRDSTESAEMQN